MKVAERALPNLPWEDRPTGSSELVWRYSKNPIIRRNDAKRANSIFNSAVVPFRDAFAGVFRVDERSRIMNLRRGFSEDGISWRIDDEPIRFVQLTREPVESEFKYDPRVVFIEDRYWVTWCNGYHGPTVGIGYTYDFETFYQIENAFPPNNRNGVLFPRKVNGKFALLNRPTDVKFSKYGDIFYSESPDMVHWGVHRFVFGPGRSPWQSVKVGAGPSPIETSEGWLLIYHGVIQSCNGFLYSFGAALLDLDKPWKVIKISNDYLLSPQEYYECVGDVPNVVFPVAALVDGDTGRMAIYYGGADTVVALAFGYVHEIVDWLLYEN